MSTFRTKAPLGVSAIATTLLLLATSACSQGEANGSGEFRYEPAATADPNARARFVELVGESDEVISALRSELDACLNPLGFEYIGAPAVPFDIYKLGGFMPPLPVEQARASGYGETREFLASRNGSDDDSVKPGYVEALWGPEKDLKTVSVTLGGATTEKETGGCDSTATSSVYGSPKNGLLASGVVFNVGLSVLTDVRASGEVKEIAGEWSECMIAAGEPKYAAPFASYKDAENGKADEIKTAVADATCRASTDYESKYDDLIDRYITGFMEKYEPQLSEVEAIRADSEERAREILGG